jgi:stage II sporulation SpoAA-like protein
MIERIDDMAPGTIGFQATGELTREDYESVLLPALREAIEGDQPVRMLFEIGPGFKQFSPGALMEDAKTGLTLGLGHLSAWKRTAVVTDVDWIRRAMELFGWMSPGEVRLFAPGELEEAKAWVAG